MSLEISKVSWISPTFHISLIYIYSLLFPYVHFVPLHGTEMSIACLTMRAPSPSLWENTALSRYCSKAPFTKFRVKTNHLSRTGQIQCLGNHQPIGFQCVWSEMAVLLTSYYYSDVFLFRSLGKMQALSGKSNGITPCGKNIHESYKCVCIYI